VSFAIDGGLVNSSNAFSGASVSADLRFGAAFASVAYQRANGDTISPPFSILNQGGWVSGSWAPGSSPSLSIFNGVYALVGATPTLDVRGALDTFANSVASATYSNTAAFQMSLPTGVSYSSASGVFLSAVPEPGSWALMLAGVGGLLTLARHRRAA
jgi:hypothetical protein